MKEPTSKELKLLEDLETDIAILPAKVTQERIAGSLAVVLGFFGLMYSIAAKGRAIAFLVRSLPDRAFRLYLEQQKDIVANLLKGIATLDALDEAQTKEWEVIRKHRSKVEAGLREILLVPASPESSSLHSGSSLSAIFRHANPREFLYLADDLADDLVDDPAEGREPVEHRTSSMEQAEGSVWGDVKFLKSQPPAEFTISQPEAPAATSQPSAAHSPSQGQKEIVMACVAAVAARNFRHLSSALNYSAQVAEEFPEDLEIQTAYMRILAGTIDARPRFRDRFAQKSASRHLVGQGLNRFTDDTFVQLAQHILQSLPFESMTPKERRLVGLLA